MLDYLTLMVDGMTSESYREIIEGALHKLEGIQQVDVDLHMGMVLVSFDAGLLDREVIRKAIEDEGFHVTAML